MKNSELQWKRINRDIHKKENPDNDDVPDTIPLELSPERPDEQIHDTSSV